MNIKLIVSDIDRTILPAGKDVSAATVQAVNACRARGVEFVVASGRWYPAALKIVRDQLGIDDGFMIVCNGGAVVRCDGSILMESTMSDDQARAAYEILRDAPVMMTAYARRCICRLHKHWLTAFRLPETSAYFHSGSYDVIDEDEAAFLNLGMKQPYKMEAYSDDPALLERLRRKLVDAGLQVNSSFPWNLEIMAPGAGKGHAVRWLTKHFGLEKQQVMGFGDYTNDLPMLENVGWPVAVGNALDEVKAACRIIAPDCDEDGVAKTIHQYILGDEEA